MSLRTRAVIPTLVAVMAAPRNTWVAIGVPGMNTAAVPVPIARLDTVPSTATHRRPSEQQREHPRNQPGTHPPREQALLRHQCEGTVRGGDQPAREADPLRLIGFQQAVAGVVLQDSGELPRQVDGVADAGIHALTADRAVNVGRVSEQESAAHAKFRRHAVMHVIS